MAAKYNHRNKNEFVCVDASLGSPTSANNNPINGFSSGNQDGALLYPVEMEQGSSAENIYPHNVEVSCAVCSVR